jgi:cardiolipin synthase
MFTFLFRHSSVWLFTSLVLLALFTVIRIIRDTRNSAKTLAYILLVFLFPLGGSIIYFTFGTNYRRRKLFSRKIFSNEHLFKKIQMQLVAFSQKTFTEGLQIIGQHQDLVRLLWKDADASLSRNKVSLLINGEEKFPEVMRVLKNAKSFIHMEYYIFEEDETGQAIIDILKQKVDEGLEVRVIYDDFGSHGLSDNKIEEMREAGIEIFPFYEVKFYLLANRINYRDHRKIIIADGEIGFIGGINISNKYLNDGKAEKLYWRDTHLKIEGPAVGSLQYHFIANWNFCSEKTLAIHQSYFPNLFQSEKEYEDLVQIVAGGPDSPSSSIMLSFFTAVSGARERVFITSPYFIPNESINDALKKAALSGKDVRLIVPGVSDSRIVNAAAHSYFRELLACGVRIFLYQKGFMHAKTMLIDDNLSIVGTANMDARSFDLNFEINAVVYGAELNRQLHQSFEADLRDSEEIFYQNWKKRAWLKEFGNDLARLLSPIL